MRTVPERGYEDQQTGGSSSLPEKHHVTCTVNVSDQVTSCLLSIERAHGKFKHNLYDWFFPESLSCGCSL